MALSAIVKMYPLLTGGLCVQLSPANQWKHSSMAERLPVKQGMNVRLNLFPLKKEVSMFWKSSKRKLREVIGLFNGHFIEVKALYALLFDDLCSISVIGEIDASKAYSFIQEKMQAEIMITYQHSYFEHTEEKMFFNNTIFILSDKRIIELGNNWCQVLHSPYQNNWASTTIKELSKLKLTNNSPAIGFARQAAAN